MNDEDTVAEIRALLREVKAADTTLALLDAFVQTYPGLLWFKRLEGSRFRMMRFSGEYSRVVMDGHDEDYEGKYDHDFWPEEVADTFVENDFEAIRNGAKRVEEPFKSDHASGVFRGVKWPFVVDGQTYVAGVGLISDE